MCNNNLLRFIKIRIETENLARSQSEILQLDLIHRYNNILWILAFCIDNICNICQL